MTEPTIAGTAPMPIEVEEGKSYFWCACGLSSNQPFCDGSHKGTEFSPVRYTAEKDGKAFFCSCKRSDKAPLCDGSHKALKD
jgi:CDGSH-type Zn-finger protein